MFNLFPAFYEDKVHIFLTEDETNTLLLAACENQVTLLSDIQAIEHDPNFERHEIAHFTAKYQRNEEMIRRIQQRVTFGLCQDLNE